MDTNTKKIDILNRGEFIQRTVDIVKLISAHKGNMTFAIDGAWGCGKTFVLEEIEDRLSNDPSKNYLVIPYNCWQYDYYDEPLVALVSALVSFMKKTRRLTASRKEKCISAAKDVGKSLLSFGAQYIENKTGIKATQAADFVKDIVGAAEEANAKEIAFDSYIDLKGALKNLKCELAKIAEKKTIVFCVDELDRCLPEYAIKVLERLHHLTEELPNTITIIAVDKTRLENTVCSIFGKEDVKDLKKTAEEYLKKFIRFEMKLDYGRQNGQAFFEKFPEFYNRFDASLYGELNGGEQFIEELFQDIPIREQEQIIEKATIFNDICFGSEKQDYSMMYMELFLTALHYYYHDDSIFIDENRVTDLQDIFGHYQRMPKAFSSEKSGFRFRRPSFASGYPEKRIIIEPNNIFMVVLLYWYHAPEHKDNYYDSDYLPVYLTNARITDNIEKLRRNIQVLKIIA